jgi:hypothetical protein
MNFHVDQSKDGIQRVLNDWWPIRQAAHRDPVVPVVPLSWPSCFSLLLWQSLEHDGHEGITMGTTAVIGSRD